MITDTPIVSVYIPTYNHARYIERALDSVLMQITTFDIEILVGEDCSTDDTKQVLREYEKTHPDKLTVFYREHNMNSEAVTNSLDLISRCRGKYIILLEGDDFWLDKYKLQKQVDFLESNQDYIAVAHNCVVVGEDSLPNGETFPECKEKEYSLALYASDIMPGQTTTLLIRNYHSGHLFDKSFFEMSHLQPGDRRLYFSLISNGKIFCIQETMSAYRHITNKGNSYSATFKRDIEHSLEWYLRQLDYAEKIKNKSAIKCARLQYLLVIRSGLFHREISFKKARELSKRIKGIFKIFFLMLIRDINRHVFRKKKVFRKI